MTRRFVLVLLLVSIAIRCIGIQRPLLDAHNIRQVHTATLTKNLAEDGYPWLKTRGDWKGREDATVVLELPLQMHLAGRLAQLTGNLDAAGRLTTIGFWALAFLLFCWLSRQLLPPSAARWAALIFAFSPLSIFFGQSFQPETLVLCLTLVVLGAFLQWCDTDRGGWLLAMGAALVLGLVIKSNEIVHLAVPVLVLGWARKGPRFLLRWQVWLVGLAALAAVVVWSRVITFYNTQSFPGWSSAAVLREFIGTPLDRLSPRYYVKLVGYMGVLGLTPVLAVFWLRGLWVEKACRRHPLLLGWGLGIALFYLVFGPGGPVEHSYYHLPALPWFCLVAALGLDGALGPAGWLGKSRALQAGVAVLWLACTGLALMNLYRPDTCAYEAARALAGCHPGKDETVLVAADHRVDTSGFDLYPTIFYYSGTRGYNLPLADRLGALDALLRAHPELVWVVQTRGAVADGMAWRERLPFFSRVPRPQAPLDAALAARGFAPVAVSAQWSVFHRVP